MKKFFYRSALFAIFCLLFLIAVNFLYFLLISRTDWNFVKRYESLQLKDPDYKVLVLGASLPQDGIDCELMSKNGIKSYNTSIDGSSVKTNYIQLEEYLKKYPEKPRYAVLGLCATLTQSFDDEGIHPIVEFTGENYKFKIKDAPISKFKWLGFEFIKKMVSSKHRHAKLSYGQLKFQKVNPDNTLFKEAPLNLPKFANSRWLGEMARLCKENGVELIILEMPGFKETQNVSPIGPYTLHFQNGYIAKLYNYNSEEFCRIFDPASDWIGNSHLNEFGAIKFTEKLMEILK